MLTLRYLMIVIVSSTLVVSCAKAADGDPAGVVNVPGMSNPDLKSYRYVAAGLDAFDEHHHLAPLVPNVKFRLLLRSGKVDTGTGALEIHIVGKGDPIAVPVDAEGTFTVPRNAQAFDDDADLMLNRKKQQFRAKVDVRTPGLPANVRRLGDLRLECEVMTAIVKEEIPLFVRLAANTLMMTTRWCAKKDMHLSFDGVAGIEGATLVMGDRKQSLRIHGEGFMAPLGDTSWPDEALIEMKVAP